MIILSTNANHSFIIHHYTGGTMNRKKYILLFITLSSIIFIFFRDGWKNHQDTQEVNSYSNVVTYGITDRNEKIIDVGTTINQNGEATFSGNLEVTQDIEDTYSYYLNVLVDGKEVNYLFDNTEQFSATKFLLSDKSSIKKEITFLNLDNGKELMVLLFKYPNKGNSISPEDSMKYSVMSLRYNISNTEEHNNKLERTTINKPNIYHANFSLVTIKSDDIFLDLEKKTGDSSTLLLGNSQENQISQHMLLAFVNGSLITIPEISSDMLFEVQGNSSTSIDFLLPKIKKANSIFQIVSVHSPFGMKNGIQSVTEVDFTNPILIK